jgi:hypothetical protein
MEPFEELMILETIPRMSGLSEEKQLTAVYREVFAWVKKIIIRYPILCKRVELLIPIQIVSLIDRNLPQCKTRAVAMQVFFKHFLKPCFSSGYSGNLLMVQSSDMWNLVYFLQEVERNFTV